MGAVDGASLFANELRKKDGAWYITSNACGITGKDGIKANTWYVCKGGKLVEFDQ